MVKYSDGNGEKLAKSRIPMLTGADGQYSYLGGKGTTSNHQVGRGAKQRKIPSEGRQIFFFFYVFPVKPCYKGRRCFAKKSN